MRERNRLASQTEGLLKLEADVADTLELIGMAEAEGDADMVFAHPREDYTRTLMTAAFALEA